VRRGAVLLALLRAVSMAALLLVAIAMPVLAASPSPSGAIGGDPRSSGQGPGLMGDPAFAVLAVVAIGLMATLGTLVYVKLTGGRRS
jgi:hypothetical protein